jgi:HAD superfamily hydrolase (TIGR01509 family)
VTAAVLFDWGDTLVKAAEWNEEVAFEGTLAGLTALRRDGVPSPEAIGLYFNERLNDLFPPDSEDEVDLAEIFRGCFAQLGCQLSEDELETYLEASQSDWLAREAVHPDVHALLEGLRVRGLRLAIVSNCATPRRFVDPALEEQGLLARVDAVVFSCEVGKVKPHPAIFRRALDEVGARAEDSFFVGDRLYHDVLGASRLGMRTVLATWFVEDESERGGTPDVRARSPLEILELVGG